MVGAYFVALSVATYLCWGRGPGFRRAALILFANWLVQVGCQLVLGATPSAVWIALDMVTALAVAFCPWSGRTHSVIATALGFQVLVHLAFHSAGHPAVWRDFYLAFNGYWGCGQLLTLVGGAWSGPLQRHWMAWFVGGRLAPALDRRSKSMEAGQ